MKYVNIFGEIKCARGGGQNAGGQWLLWRRRSAALPLQLAKVSRNGRSHPKHKGKEGGSFSVKTDKEIRIYVLQLWTFLGLFSFRETERLEQSGYQAGDSACQSEQCDRSGLNKSKLAAMLMPGIITQKRFASTAELRAAIACVAALKSCWRRLQAARRNKPSVLIQLTFKFLFTLPPGWNFPPLFSIHFFFLICQHLCFAQPVFSASFHECVIVRKSPEGRISQSEWRTTLPAITSQWSSFKLH